MSQKRTATFLAIAAILGGLVLLGTLAGPTLFLSRFLDTSDGCLEYTPGMESANFVMPKTARRIGSTCETWQDSVTATIWFDMDAAEFDTFLADLPDDLDFEPASYSPPYLWWPGSQSAEDFLFATTRRTCDELLEANSFPRPPACIMSVWVDISNVDTYQVMIAFSLSY